MFELGLQIRDDGSLVFQQLPVVYVECMLMIPSTLDDDDERVRARLFPDVYPEQADNAEWERYGKPELFALFASQAEIVREDLRGLEPEAEGFGYRLEIPGGHRMAWMAALNAARLMLAEKHGIDARDMSEPLNVEEPTEKDFARYRIDRLGELEELFVQVGELGPGGALYDPDEDEDDDEDDDEAGPGDEAKP